VTAAAAPSSFRLRRGKACFFLGATGPKATTDGRAAVAGRHLPCLFSFLLLPLLLCPSFLARVRVSVDFFSSAASGSSPRDDGGDSGVPFPHHPFPSRVTL
jgi:hypothetical protein